MGRHGVGNSLKGGICVGLHAKKGLGHVVEITLVRSASREEQTVRHGGDKSIAMVTALNGSRGMICTGYFVYVGGDNFLQSTENAGDILP